MENISTNLNLIQAAADGDFERVLHELEAGASTLWSRSRRINKSSIDGETALHCAVENQNEKMVQLLLLRNADPNHSQLRTLRGTFGRKTGP